MDLEICIDSVESAVAAGKGGADRVELCSALSEGGITPSSGLIHAVREAGNVDVMVMIRPRGGDFVYSESEYDVMRRDILDAKACGVSGIVLGVLTRDGAVDGSRTRALVNLAHPLKVTFHRAFDTCRDKDRALEEIIACGADRILTSGGATDALLGAATIARMHQKASGRICIMAGAGVGIANVRELALRTHIRSFHTSLDVKVKSAPHESEAEFDFHPAEFARWLVREDDVRALKVALDEVEAEIKRSAPSI